MRPTRFALSPPSIIHFPLCPGFLAPTRSPNRHSSRAVISNHHWRQVSSFENSIHNSCVMPAAYEINQMTRLIHTHYISHFAVNCEFSRVFYAYIDSSFAIINFSNDKSIQFSNYIANYVIQCAMKLILRRGDSHWLFDRWFRIVGQIGVSFNARMEWY